MSAAARAFGPALGLLAGGVGRAYPGAVLAVLYRGEIVLQHAVGFAAHRPAPRPATTATIYDLASLTKVVATTPLILKAAMQRRLGLDNPVVRHLPEFPHREVTVRHLLAHTSGLPAWIPFYLEAEGYEAIVARAATTPIEAPPGMRVVYSDIGFILLGEVARRSLGQAIDDAACRRVFEPLAMRDTRYRPPAALRARVAPTEDGTEIEQQMAASTRERPTIEPARRHHLWRTTLVWGEVHDGNAHAMGGVSGHAGLFGTAGDLIEYARMWLARGCGPGSRVLSPEMVAEATTPQTAGDTVRGLGWALTGTQGWWGGALSARAYGHTGFTGTALAIDPEHDLAIALLANAIHLGRDRTEILALRPRIAEAVARALLPRPPA